MTAGEKARLRVNYNGNPWARSQEVCSFEKSDIRRINTVKNFLAGNWVDKPKKIEVKNPFDNSIIDTVPRADAADLEKALAFAERGARVMAKLSSYERWKILRKAADMMAARNEELGQIISKEEGKIIAEGRGEASRAVETMMGSAE